MVIYLGYLLPNTSSGIPGKTDRPSSLFSLALAGVYLANISQCCWWSLTLRAIPPPLHPYLYNIRCHRRSTFLWHCPHSYLHRTLSGSLSYSARTFLKLFKSLRPFRLLSFYILTLEIIIFYFQ